MRRDRARSVMTSGEKALSLARALVQQKASAAAGVPEAVFRSLGEQMIRFRRRRVAADPRAKKLMPLATEVAQEMQAVELVLSESLLAAIANEAGLSPGHLAGFLETREEDEVTFGDRKALKRLFETLAHDPELFEALGVFCAYCLIDVKERLSPLPEELE